MMTTLYAIDEISGVYVDAAVGNEANELLFLSVWGLDTAIQEFLGRLSLPWREGGISDITLKTIDNTEGESRGERKKWYNIRNINFFQKLTGRSTSKDSLFNNLVHLWLYDKSASDIDRANHCCLLLKQTAEDAAKFEVRLWEAVKTVCPVPLLDEWKHIMENFQQREWIQYHSGIKVDAVQLDFSDSDIESSISAWIQEGIFTLPQKNKKKRHLFVVN